MPAPPQLAHPDDYARLRDALLGHGYTEAGVREVLRVPAHQMPKAIDTPRLLRRANNDSPLHVLCRLFLIGVPTPRDDVQRAFAPIEVDALIDAGLLTYEAGEVRSTVRLVPHRDLFLAMDVLRDAGSTPPDTVMGVGGSTLSLANAMVRRPARRALDLGTGCGTLALQAAGHAEAVWATDLNPRATAFAEFNARLNGLDHITCLTGSLFEPVEGMTFDYIISNPPYVISPESRLIYRDNQLRGDTFCRQLLRETTERLAEGGFAQVLLNWPHYAGQDWRESFIELFDGSGCDLWLLCSEGEEKELEDYAAMWLDLSQYTSLAEYTAAFDRWMAFYDADGIERISHGLATLRKRSSGGNWTRFEDAPEKMLGLAGEDIALGFELHDFVLTAGDDQLLETALCLAPSVRMRQEFQATDGGWSAQSIELRRAQGMTWTANVDPYVAGLAARCDGQRPLRSLIAELSEATGQSVDALTPPVLEVVRALVDGGFLAPERHKGHADAT